MLKESDLDKYRKIIEEDEFSAVSEPVHVCYIMRVSIYEYNYTKRIYIYTLYHMGVYFCFYLIV